jgi:hypothetical protein
MGALFADLDYYGRPELAGKEPRRVLDLALSTLSMAGIPAPSIAIGSGRGMYLVWLHSPIPRAALPRWRACQERLQSVLAPLGADPKSRDAARVLRVVGTRHRRAGVQVEALTTTRESRPFEELADAILPFTRAELHDLRVQKAHRRSQKPLWTPPKDFTQANPLGGPSERSAGPQAAQVVRRADARLPRPVAVPGGCRDELDQPA